MAARPPALRSTGEATIAPAPDSGHEAVKRSLREATLRSRDRLSATQREQASRAAVARLRGLPVVREAGSVLTYAATPRELDPGGLLEHLRERGARTLLPRVRGEELELVGAAGVSDLALSPLGIREPEGRAVDPQVVEVALVPGVAFDPRGGRLGRGGGHYDRLLARLPAGAVTIGLCFSCQLVPHVPRESHDIDVDLVVTERAVHGQRPG